MARVPYPVPQLPAGRAPVVRRESAPLPGEEDVTHVEFADPDTGTVYWRAPMVPATDEAAGQAHGELCRARTALRLDAEAQAAAAAAAIAAQGRP